MNTPEKDLQVHIEQALETHGINRNGLLSLSIQTEIWQGIRKYVDEVSDNLMSTLEEHVD